MEIADKNALYTHLKNDIVDKIKEWFRINGNKASAVIGISGGKDSTVAAALLVEALGKDRVIGVMMPNGIQPDIADSERVIKHLGIDNYTVNIYDIYNAQIKAIRANEIPISDDTKINLPPRIRMATLYAIAQSLPNGGRVINTCNASEDFVGYSTKFGDSAGDMSPLGDCFVSEVIGIGDILGLPKDLVHKAPSDGLCGKTDEDRFGFTYDDIERYIRNGTSGNENIDARIKDMHTKSLHKIKPMYVCKKIITIPNC